MSTSIHTRTTAVLLAASLLLLGGCDKADETAQPAQEPMQAPAAPAREPASPAPPAQPEPEMEPPAGTMQEQMSPQDQGGMAQPPAAAQPETGAATQSAAAGGGDTETALRNAGCFACHEVEQKKLGPAYSWVAHRYQDDANAVETLMGSIKNGGSGKWTALTGGIPMPPNMQLSDEQTRAMAQWILDREPQEPPAP